MEKVNLHNYMGYIFDYENGDISEDKIIELFQFLVDTQLINHFQGHYQRTAMDLIESGLIKLSNKR